MRHTFLLWQIAQTVLTNSWTPMNQRKVVVWRLTIFVLESKSQQVCQIGGTICNHKSSDRAKLFLSECHSVGVSKHALCSESWQHVWWILSRSAWTMSDNVSMHVLNFLETSEALKLCNICWFRKKNVFRHSHCIRSLLWVVSAPIDGIDPKWNNKQFLSAWEL